jgi:ribosomal protein S18 acetylase RimI-like enzyme
MTIRDIVTATMGRNSIKNPGWSPGEFKAICDVTAKRFPRGEVSCDPLNPRRHIRFAIPEDAAQIEQMKSSTGGQAFPLSWGTQQEIIGFQLVIAEGNRIIGQIFGRGHLHGVQIANLDFKMEGAFVDPAYRGQGVGRSLAKGLALVIETIRQNAGIVLRESADGNCDIWSHTDPGSAADAVRRTAAAEVVILAGMARAAYQASHIAQNPQNSHAT